MNFDFFNKLKRKVNYLYIKLFFIEVKLNLCSLLFISLTISLSKKFIF